MEQPLRKSAQTYFLSLLHNAARRGWIDIQQVHNEYNGRVLEYAADYICSFPKEELVARAKEFYKEYIYPLSLKKNERIILERVLRDPVNMTRLRVPLGGQANLDIKTRFENGFAEPSSEESFFASSAKVEEATDYDLKVGGGPPPAPGGLPPLVARGVDKLPEGERRTLFTYAEELSYRRAAERLNVAVGTVKTVIGRVRRKLRPLSTP